MQLSAERFRLSICGPICTGIGKTSRPGGLRRCPRSEPNPSRPMSASWPANGRAHPSGLSPSGPCPSGCPPVPEGGIQTISQHGQSHDVPQRGRFQGAPNASRTLAACPWTVPRRSEKGAWSLVQLDTCSTCVRDGSESTQEALENRGWPAPSRIAGSARGQVCDAYLISNRIQTSTRYNEWYWGRGSGGGWALPSTPWPRSRFDIPGWCGF